MYRGYTKNFVEIWANLGMSISHLNLQSILPKNTKEILLFYFFGFCFIFCSCQTILHNLDHFVWSIRFFWYPYCHTLWHLMSYGICHKMPFYGILWFTSREFLLTLILIDFENFTLTDAYADIGDLINIQIFTNFWMVKNDMLMLIPILLYLTILTDNDL